MQISRNWVLSPGLSGDATLVCSPQGTLWMGTRDRPAQKFLESPSGLLLSGFMSLRLILVKMEPDMSRFSRDPLFLPLHFNRSFLGQVLRIELAF